MAHNSSTSSFSFTSSSTSESSAFSSPCSSPSSLPLSLPPYLCKLSVPFLWEEKPGITKPTSSPSLSNPLKPCTTTISKNLFYGTSLDLPPLPPPPCLSHPALLSSSSSTRDMKLLNAASHSLSSRRLLEAKSSKEKQQEDPFLLALKACTKVDKRDDSRGGKASFDGLSIFKPSKKNVERCKSRRNAEKDSGREVSFNHHQAARQEPLFNGQDNGRLRASRVEARCPNLYTLMNEESTKGAHHHMNVGGKPSSVNGCVMNVGVENRGKEDVSMQELHVKHSTGREEGGRPPTTSKGNVIDDGQYRGHIYKDAKAKAKAKAWYDDGQYIGYNHMDDKAKAYYGRQSIDALDISMKQGHSKAKHINSHVAQFNHCGLGSMNFSDNEDQHHVSKLHMLSDMLGCKTLSPVINGAAIHPSLCFQEKLFSRSCR